MVYEYDFPQASPCSNVIIYARTEEGINILLTERAPSVGEGYAVSAGGFYEVKDSFNKSGEMIDGRLELYREMEEELGKDLLHIVLPYEHFAAKAEYLWDGLIAGKPEDNPHGSYPIVHNVVMRMVEVTPEELVLLHNSPLTEEVKAKHVVTLNYEDNRREKLDLSPLENFWGAFKYPHEESGVKKFLKKVSLR